jgi:hypothetical protein
MEGTELIVPEDVKETPAGPNGNGFVCIDTVFQHIVGSDGEIYTRKNGVVSLSPEDDNEDES